MSIKLPARAYSDAMATAPALNRPIPVTAASVPAQARRDAVHAVAGRHDWTEVFGPLASQGGCRFGCKLYARRWGASVRFAVIHSSIYGHRA